MSNIQIVSPESVGASAERLANVDELAKRNLKDQLGYGIALLAARDGKVFYRKAFGMANPYNNRKLKEDDIFFLMSLSKSVCAVSVLRAIDSGALSFDTKVCEIIPDFAKAGKQNVSIYDLLTHRCNLYTLMSPPPGVGMDLDSIVAAACNLEYVSDVGNRVYYQPFMTYAVLGKIVSLLDKKGRSYKQIIEEDIFKPLGMKDSTVSCDPKNPRRVPALYVGQPQDGPFSKIWNNVPEDLSFPAANAHSTIDDMFIFSEMLRNGGSYEGVRILSPAITKYALKNHTGDAPNETFMCRLAEIGLDSSTPMNYTLAGGYLRGEGDYMTGTGYTASPNSFYGLGGGSTMFMFDPERKLTFVFLSSGLLNGERHRRRVCRYSDLILSSLEDWACQ